VKVRRRIHSPFGDSIPGCVPSIRAGIRSREFVFFVVKQMVRLHHCSRTEVTRADTTLAGMSTARNVHSARGSATSR